MSKQELWQTVKAQIKCNKNVFDQGLHSLLSIGLKFHVYKCTCRNKNYPVQRQGTFNMLPDHRFR